VVLAGVVVLAASLLPVQERLFRRALVPVRQIGSEFMSPLDEGDRRYMPTTLPGISPQ
jgi:Cu(I)/Ag(I) efflux system membrane protein CusA/SilA